MRTIFSGKLRGMWSHGILQTTWRFLDSQFKDLVSKSCGVFFNSHVIREHWIN